MSFLSFWDGVCRHNWNDQKLKKVDFFRVPANHSFTAQNAVFFGTLKID